MADDNRPIQYMRYAIGEIVLVVIGILIALAINNWHNERLDKQGVKVTGRNIHDEFAKNQLILRNTIGIYRCIQCKFVFDLPYGSSKRRIIRT